MKRQCTLLALIKSDPMHSLCVIPLHVCYGPMKNYSYIFFREHTQHAIVVDPAWEMHKYTDAFRLYGIEPSHILLTHAHHDHLNLVETFLDLYPIDVWVSDKESIKLPFPPARVKQFSHSQVLYFDDLACTAFHTPGHSPGSSCFLIEGHLFSGDTLFIEGCGMCLDLEANPEDLHASIMFLKRTLSPWTKIYPGHRFRAYPGQTFDYVLKNNLYLHLENKEDFVKYRMRNNQLNPFDFK
jgi:hydroxyacylglutathione hydrolase